MTKPTLVALFSLGLAWSAGCRGDQEIRQECTFDPDAGDAAHESCPPCKTASDCALVSNECHPVGSCAPAALGIATSLEGCAYPYDVPDDPCACVEQNCVPRD